MTESAELGVLPSRPSGWTDPVVDCDVHAVVPNLAALLEYMEPLWRQWTSERGWAGPLGTASIYPPGAPTTARPDCRPTDGRPPASDVELLREQLLDPWQLDYAILNCYYGIDSVRHPDMAAALASAVNDWLIAEWLDRDERLRASLVVPARDPKAMIREIERVGDHPGFVQVLMPVRSDRLLGNRLWHPVYEAMARRQLVLGVHWGGTSDGAPSPTGWPSWYVEEYASEWQVYMAQVTSLIAEGVFEVVPDLRVAFFECGFAWVPLWGWRMNKEWKGLRRELPWLKRPPLDVLREHMRFSVAPTDVDTQEHLEQTLRWLGSEDLLLYASDYPHYHEDQVATLLAAMPTSAQAKMMAGNACEWYRL